MNIITFFKRFIFDIDLYKSIPLQMEQYLLRNHETRKYLQEQAYRLQQGIVTTTTQQVTPLFICLICNFGILFESPSAVAKAAATLPGVHIKHETYRASIYKNGSRTELHTLFKKAYIAYISMHTHKLSMSNRALCRQVLLYLFFETRFAVYLSNMRWMEVSCNKGAI